MTIGDNPARTINYGYDAANRLVSVADHLDNETLYSYDLAGNRQTLTYPNGVVTSYDYDHRNRLTELVTTSTGAELAKYTYTHYADGNRETVTETDGKYIAYQYDPSGRLERETKRTGAQNITYDIGYNHDAVGNLLEKTDHETHSTTSYTYNEADQITNAGFDYDDNGNETAEPGATYEYDSQNRLSGATKGGTTYSYSYDGDGNRISQAEDGSAIEYIVDRMGGLAQVVAEVTLDTTIQVFYVRGDDLISQWRKSDGQAC